MLVKTNLFTQKNISLLQQITTICEIFTEQKIKPGDLMKSKTGNDYRYFMVYERRTVEGAYNLEDFLNIIRDI